MNTLTSLFEQFYKLQISRTTNEEFANSLSELENAFKNSDTFQNSEDEKVFGVFVLEWLIQSGFITFKTFLRHIIAEKELNDFVMQNDIQLLQYFKKYFTYQLSGPLVKADAILRQQETVLSQVQKTYDPVQTSIIPHLKFLTWLLSILQTSVTTQLKEYNRFLIPPLLQALDDVREETMTNLYPALVLFFEMNIRNTEALQTLGLQLCFEEAILKSFWSFRVSNFQYLSKTKMAIESSSISHLLEQILKCLIMNLQIPLTEPKRKALPSKQKEKIFQLQPLTNEQIRQEKIYTAVLSGALESNNPKIRLTYLSAFQSFYQILDQKLAYKHLKLFIRLCVFYLQDTLHPEIQNEVLSLIQIFYPKIKKRLGHYHSDLCAILAECVTTEPILEYHSDFNRNAYKKFKEEIPLFLSWLENHLDDEQLKEFHNNINLLSKLDNFPFNSFYSNKA